MLEFLFTGALGALLILMCSLSVYELLRLVWQRLPTMKAHPRKRVLAVVAAVFGGHIINIWIFGLVYYLLYINGYGTFTGTDIERGIYKLDIFGAVYFSAVSYTTLGLGDIAPEGALRMIASVEALTGFVMIGWTVSFTYLAMEKFWAMPHRRKGGE